VSFATDLDEARTQAEAWIATVAAARGWSSPWITTSDEIVEAAHADADGWFLDDVGAFWQGMADRFEAIAEHSTVPTGWSELAAAFGGGTAAAASAEAEAAAWGIGAAGEAIADSLTDAQELVDPKQSPWPWIALVAGAIVLVAAVKR